jgi:hypothetical protein
MTEHRHDVPNEPPGPLGAALQAALQGYLHQQLADHDLHRAVARWVARAKAEGLRAEELILRFNEMWTSLPEVQRAAPSKQKDLRERLVSECISDYYADTE